MKMAPTVQWGRVEGICGKIKWSLETDLLMIYSAMEEDFLRIYKWLSYPLCQNNLWTFVIVCVTLQISEAWKRQEFTIKSETNSVGRKAVLGNRVKMDQQTIKWKWETKV